ncbi:hypothetical protein C8J56DRAFT_1039066 [Mycena floridula]|nr:hypothetical protein C8J56DRAFT_1039066 [Mycena floridula]
MSNEQYTDVFGRCHDAQGNIIWPPYTRIWDTECNHLDAVHLAVLADLCDNEPIQPNSAQQHLYPQNYVITTPNADYILQPFLGTLSVQAFADGRFGPADFTLSPQLWYPRSSHLAIAERFPGHDLVMQHPRSFLWLRVKKEVDFMVDSGCTEESSGVLHPAVMKALTDGDQTKHWNREMCDVHWCFWLPLFNGIVKNCWVYVKKELMGAITKSSAVAQEFFSMGVPVWILQPISAIPKNINIRAESQPVIPRMTVDDWSVCPFRTIYYGPPSLARTVACLRIEIGENDVKEDSSVEYAGGIIRDWSSSNRDREMTAKSAFVGSLKKKASLKRSEKWILHLTDHDLLPRPSDIWRIAVEKIDTGNLQEGSRQENPLGFYFPPPELLVKGEKIGELVLCWAATRSPWMAQSRVSPKVPSSMVWKRHLCSLQSQYFHSGRTSTLVPPSTAPLTGAKARWMKADHQAEGLFGGLDISSECPKEIIFGPFTLSFNKSPSDFITRRFTWELFEGNFRFELEKLDQVKRPEEWAGEEKAAERASVIQPVFPDRSLLASESAETEHGIAARNWNGWLKYVEALRLLVGSWREGKSLESLTDLEDVRLFVHQAGLDKSMLSKLEKVEKSVAERYCQIFFDVYSRAPTVPRQYPEY